MKVEQIFKNIKYRAIGECKSDITSLACDTSKVAERSVFYCLEGINNDGHNFADIAVQKGADLIVCNRPLDIDIPQIVVDDTRAVMAQSAGNFYDNPRDKITLIGVTGTNGKTTTTYMLQSILKQAGKKVGVIGTIGIDIDGVKRPATMTTPDPIELHRIFAEMVRAKVDTVVMEVSAHAIALNKMAGVVCDIGILTNVTQDHLDFFKTFGNYAKIKASFIDSKFCKSAIVNVDDMVGKHIILGDKNIPVFSYGLKNPCDVFSPKYNLSLQGSRYILNLFDNVLTINTKLVGEFNLYNALGAAGACKMLGVNAKDITRGLNDMDFVPGRFNILTLPDGIQVVIDYAHTPDGLFNILSSVKNMVGEKKIISVFGCGGNRDTLKRPIMGQISAEYADYTILTNDNPRLEEPRQIIREIEKGMEGLTHNYLCIKDRKEAIKYAIGLASPGDVVVLSGKGAEEYMDINGVKYPYNEKETVMEAYNELARREIGKC